MFFNLEFFLILLIFGDLFKKKMVQSRDLASVKQYFVKTIFLEFRGVPKYISTLDDFVIFYNL